MRCWRRSRRSSGTSTGRSCRARFAPLGTAIAIQDGKLVSTCQGLAAGMVITAKSGDFSNTAELTHTNDQLDVCVFKSKGATPGLKFRGDLPNPADKLQAVFVNSNGRPEARQVTGAHAVQDAQGPAFEVRAAATLPNGSVLFDPYGRFVGIVVGAASRRRRFGVRTRLAAHRARQGDGRRKAVRRGSAAATQCRTGRAALRRAPRHRAIATSCTTPRARKSRKPTTTPWNKVLNKAK